MNKEMLIGRLIGLAGAVHNGEKTENTDDLVVKTLQFCGQISGFDSSTFTSTNTPVTGSGTDVNTSSDNTPSNNDDSVSTLEKLYEELADEKTHISPNCACCKNPCGNTSDCDISAWKDGDPKILQKKEELLEMLVEGVPSKSELPDTVYKALSFLGYDLQINSYNNMMEELKTWLDR